MDVDCGNRLLKSAIDYWVHLRVRDHETGKVTTHGIPDLVVFADPADGGLGACMYGEQPHRLKVCVPRPLTDFSAALNKHASAQWKLENPKRAAAKTYERFRRGELSVSGKRIEAELEAGVFESNRPDGLKYLEDHAAAGALHEAIARWRALGGEHGGVRQAATDGRLVDKIKGAIHGVLTKTTEAWKDKTVDKKMLSWASPWEHTNRMEGVALGVGAGAPGVLGEVRYDGKKIARSQAIKMMAAGSRAGQDLFGEMGSMSDMFLNGYITKPLAAGLVSSTHNVLVDLALVASMKVMWAENPESRMDPSGWKSGRHYDLLCAANLHAEKWLAQHPWWGLQMGF
jgi:hypothetical protein